MAPYNEEVTTPVSTVRTPVAENAQYQLDVSAPSANEFKKDQADMPRKKFLWWHMNKKQRAWLIAALAVLLVAVLLIIVFFAIIPAVFHHYVNSVDLTVNYLDVTNIPNSDTITVELSLNVHHDVSITASSAASTASLLFAGAEFGTIAFPALDIASGEQNYNLNIDGDLTITDLDVFNVMANTILTKDSVTLEASVELKAHGLGLTYGGLSLERSLELKGFNQFSDPAPEIQYIDWFGCENDEYQMDINVTLDNPSGMGLEGIGALNMSLYYGDSYLGYAISQKPKLGLPRGESDQVFRLTVDQDSNVLKSMVMGVMAGSAQYYIVGNNPYATEYTQFAEAIASVNMSVLYTDKLANIGLNASCHILSSLLA